MLLKFSHNVRQREMERWHVHWPHEWQFSKWQEWNKAERAHGKETSSKETEARSTESGWRKKVG